MRPLLSSITISILFSILIVGSDWLVSRSFSLLQSGIFLLWILCLTLLIKSYRVIYLAILIFGFLHYLFFSYFHRTIESVDISLFFSHIEESFESFFALYSLFVLPFVIVAVGLFFIRYTKRIQTATLRPKIWISYPLLLILLLLNLNSNMALQLLNALIDRPLQTSTISHIQEIPLYPKREVDYNIVLLLGESMKYSEYVESKLQKQSLFYKKIYSGATNTDVSIPLLLNIKNNPLDLTKTNESNLFRLAKKSHLQTSFISIQTQKSLQYIKPYLQPKQIDYYKSYSKKERKPLFDLLLLDELRQIDLSQPNFIVMQQIGQHSPYHYFQGKKSDNPAINYQKSVDYSFQLYTQIENYLKSSKKPFILIYTSDHGEFTGEGGRYGHNRFDPIIYQVPLFILSNIELPNHYAEIRSHYNLSEFLLYLLGYKEELELSEEQSIVNGTMLSREDGFRVMP